MHLLTGAVRTYAWGSRNHIPKFLGVPPTGEPQAELWFGAHDADPSRLPDGRYLNDAIREDPVGMLGERVTSLFGPRLPFLVKALAAAEPLSLQVHPTTARARIGFVEENAAGIPVDAPERNYRDEFHKPEMVFALTRFEGMAGFRDVGRSAQILRLLDLPWADEVAWRLESGPAFQALHGVVAEMLSMGGDDLADLLATLGAAALRAEERGHREDLRNRRRDLERTAVAREGTRVFAQTAQLVKRYPDDPGVLVTLLLNHVVLAPGEAMFLDAGVIHAYTSGFGLEVMASSDNVVRAGLTAKHVDVGELLEIANFTPMPPPLWQPSVHGSSEHFAPPATEFEVVIGDGSIAEVRLNGPRIVVALDEPVEVEAANRERATLTRGEAVFVSDADGAITVAGAGRVAVAAVPD